MGTELDHDKISPTAKLVAYWRQFTDIPFSKDVAPLFRVEDVYKGMFKEDSGIMAGDIWAPLLELRYKCIQHYVESQGVKQVLEFASGISLRGLAMTEDPEMVYVESDLPGLTQEKERLLNTIMERNGISTRSGLHIHSANILHYDEIEPALRFFDRTKPLIITHEGLFQYLTRAEKGIAAKNIHRIFSQFKGVWVTPDFDTHESLWGQHLGGERAKKAIEVIRETTNRDFESNAFADDDDVIQYFSQFGFKVDTIPQMQAGIKLSSLTEKCPPETQSAIDQSRLWVLTIR